VELSKIVIGKPVSKEDVFNTGLITPEELGKFARKGYEKY
jgi:hypothetical protein